MIVATPRQQPRDTDTTTAQSQRPHHHCYSLIEGTRGGSRPFPFFECTVGRTLQRLYSCKAQRKRESKQHKTMASTSPNAAKATPMPSVPQVTPSHDESLSKRMSVEKGIVDELLLVCGVIGSTDPDTKEFIPVTDCLNWLQDLQRALRRDDDLYRPVSLLIGNWKVVPHKLLPLVLSSRYDNPMVLTVVKILVILTKPLSETTKRAGRMVIDTKSKKVPER